jgi:hypothetical protein
VVAGTTPAYQDLTCTPTSYSPEYFKDHFPGSKLILGGFTGSGKVYFVDPFSDLIPVASLQVGLVNSLEDGKYVTRFYTILANGSVSAPQVFDSYVDRLEKPDTRCLLTSPNTLFYQLDLFSLGEYFGTTLETNTHFNKTSGNLIVEEVFRYTQDKIVTTYSQYDDASNSLVLFNTFSVARDPTFHPVNKRTESNIPVVALGRVFVPLADIPSVHKDAILAHAAI